MLLFGYVPVFGTIPLENLVVNGVRFELGSSASFWKFSNGIQVELFLVGITDNGRVRFMDENGQMRTMKLSDLAASSRNQAKVFEDAMSGKGLVKRQGFWMTPDNAAAFDTNLANAQASRKTAANRVDLPQQGERDGRASSYEMGFPKEIGASKPSTASAFIKPMLLTGTQQDRSICIPKTREPHVVRDQYLVPEGSELIIQAGATILFEKNGSIQCDGTLIMQGVKDDPILCKGKTTGFGTWNGISIKTSDSVLEYVQITGAKIGLTTSHGSMFIRSCVFARCEVGVAANGKPTFENCIVSENRNDGVQKSGYAGGGGTTAVFDHCSFVNNGGWGFSGRYYASPTFESCLFEANRKGGVYAQHYECKIIAHRNVFRKNGRYDVDNDSGASWDFHENWWGTQITQILQSRGPGTNLPNIHDGRDKNNPNIVDVSNYLTKEPTDYGASVENVLFMTRIGR